MEHLHAFYLDEIIDGSTFTGWIDLGMDIRVRKKVKLVNVKCHSSHVPRGQEAKQFVQDTLRGNDLYIQFFRDKFRKWSTILSVLYIKNGQEYTNLNDLLIKHEFAYMLKDEVVNVE